MDRGSAWGGNASREGCNEDDFINLISAMNSRKTTCQKFWLFRRFCGPPNGFEEGIREVGWSCWICLMPHRCSARASRMRLSTILNRMETGMVQPLSWRKADSRRTSSSCSPHHCRSRQANIGNQVASQEEVCIGLTTRCRASRNNLPNSPYFFSRGVRSSIRRGMCAVKS